MTTYAEATVSGRTPSGTNVDEGKVRKELGRITAFVPTEAIGPYAAIIGIFKPASDGERWAILGIVAGIAVFLCWWFWRSGPKLPRKALYWSMAFALVGLAAWAAALPDSPFFVINDYNTAVGGVAIIALAPIIPRLAVLFGVAPPP